MKICLLVDFLVQADHRVKSKKKNEDEYVPGLLNMKVTVIPVVTGALGTDTKVLVREDIGLRNKRTSGDNPNYGFVKIGQNTKKSPGDLKVLLLLKF